jgi:hypothetical protein
MYVYGAGVMYVYGALFFVIMYQVFMSQCVN